MSARCSHPPDVIVGERRACESAYGSRWGKVDGPPWVFVTFATCVLCRVSAIVKKEVKP